MCSFGTTGLSLQVKYGKYHVSVGVIVGKRYGSVFEIGAKKKQLVHLPGETHLTRSESESAALPENAAESADNRRLVDSTDNQKLSAEAIAELRSSGASGQEIIAALVANSESWESKTAFSQQKWLARKEQKYAPRVRVVRCDAESVCESYFFKHRDRVNNLRFDSLAQILAFGNVYAGVQATVFDTCSGVVLAAVAERLGGHGRILAPYAGTHPSMDACKQMNFSPDVERAIISFHTSEFGKLEATAGEEWPDESPEAVSARTQAVIDDIGPQLAKKLDSFKTPKERDAFVEKRNARLCRQGAKPQPATIRHWLRGKSDSLIISTHFHPTAVLLQLWPTLAPAAPFVVFCEYVEPLVQCFRELQKRQIACKLQLGNTWTREFQVLPGRTHPAMNMTSCSGFILTGVKVHKRNDGWQFVEKVKETKKARPDGVGPRAEGEDTPP